MNQSCFRPLGLAALLALLPGLATSAHAVENRGVPAVDKDKLTATIEEAGDEDWFVMDLLEGTFLTVAVKAGKGTDLLPTIVLVDPDGDPLNGVPVVDGTSKASLKNFPIAESGRWGIVIKGILNGTGAFTAAFKAKAPKKVIQKAQTLGAGQTLDITIPGDDGGLLTFVLKEKDGPPLQDVELLDRDENPFGSFETKANAKKVAQERGGTTHKGKSIAMNDGFGDYTLRLTGPATGTSTFDLKAKIKLLKPVKRKETLGPEPVLSSVTPTQGSEDTQIVLTGNNLNGNTTIYFGDVGVTSQNFVLGTDGENQTVTLNPPPDVETADDGSAVISAQNADGQIAILGQTFKYFGRPRPTSVDPEVSPLAGNISIDLFGLNFRQGHTVTIGGIAATNVVVHAPNYLTCTVPELPAGTAPIVITDEFMRESDPLNTLTVVDAPTATSADPSSVPSNGGAMVTLTGTDFRDGISITVNGTGVLDLEIVDDTTATFTAPAGEAGVILLRLEDEFSQVSTTNSVLSFDRSFFDMTSTLVPAAPGTTDFFGSTAALGDLDGDDDLDLVIAQRTAADRTGGGKYSGSWVFLNDGSGAFSNETASKHAAFNDEGDDGQFGHVSIYDLDGNGRDDVVLSRPYPLSTSSYIFEIDGQNTAYYATTSQAACPTTFNPTFSSCADYQTYFGTRVLDAGAGGNLSDVSTTRLPDPGSTPAFTYGNRWQGWTHVIGDIDGDENPDLVITSARAIITGTPNTPISVNGTNYIRESFARSEATRVLRGTGGGNFAVLAGAIPDLVNGQIWNPSTQTSSAGQTEDWDGTASALGDLDGDGSLDLVIVRDVPVHAFADGNDYRIKATRVLMNDGYGDFTHKTNAMPTAYGATNAGSSDYWQGDAVLLADLNNDDDLDLVLGRAQATYWYDSQAGIYKLSPAIRIFEGNGDGTFTEATGSFLAANLFRTGGNDTILGASALAVGDLDGDLDPDLVVGSDIDFVYDSGNGTGGYDIVPAGYRLATQVLENQGNGTFTSASAAWMPPVVGGEWFRSIDLQLGDLDGDDDLDLVLVSLEDEDYPLPGRHLRVLMNK